MQSGEKAAAQQQQDAEPESDARYSLPITFATSAEWEGVDGYHALLAVSDTLVVTKGRRPCEAVVWRPDGGNGGDGSSRNPATIKISLEYGPLTACELSLDGSLLLL